MSSFVGSASSAQSSVADAIASYRRSQYIVAESTVPSIEPELSDEENGFIEEDEASLTPHPRSPADSDIFFEWDGFDESPSASYQGIASENTPLVRKISFSSVQHPRYTVPSTPVLQRRSSNTGSTHKNRDVIQLSGQSTFGQTLFNSVAILLGIGILSVSLAFACAGWVMGTILIVFYGFISCYTAKVLARIILSDPRLRSYSDIGRKAFGSRSTGFIASMFCLELFSVSVVLVTLYADSLNTVWNAYSANTYKLWALIFLIPTVFMPLSVLSYTSILSVVSTLLIVAVVLIDGFSKPDPPGSLLSPTETYFGTQSLKGLGFSFGLFMAGFSGHAVIPSLVRDMSDPSQFDKMIDYAFIIATAVYTLVGFAGYLMFGNAVSEEISMDLLRTPGYNAILNQIALWMLVVSPLTKFGLTTHPLNTTLDILLGIDGSDVDVNMKSILRTCQRLLMTCLSVSVSILVPEFSSMMAFLGSFSAFLICVIGPISAKIAIEGKYNMFDAVVFGLAVVMAVWGTAVAFM